LQTQQESNYAALQKSDRDVADLSATRAEHAADANIPEATVIDTVTCSSSTSVKLKQYQRRTQLALNWIDLMMHNSHLLTTQLALMTQL
jgi:hypothetical protein